MLGLLGEATGTQFRRFVDDLVLILLVPKSGAVPTAYRPAESVSLVQTRNPSNHRGSRVECDSSFATPCTKQKFQEGLKLCMRVFALLSPRDAEWIENASELWPPVLRRRLNSALD